MLERVEQEEKGIKVVYVYLHCDTEIQLKRIESRGREMEKEIKKEYLQGLNDVYLEVLKPRIKDYLFKEYNTDCSDQNSLHSQILSALEEEKSWMPVKKGWKKAGKR